jgi:hypothetical protein
MARMKQHKHIANLNTQLFMFYDWSMNITDYTNTPATALLRLPSVSRFYWSIFGLHVDGPRVRFRKPFCTTCIDVAQ